jgi:hypothetical protein
MKLAFLILSMSALVGCGTQFNASGPLEADGGEAGTPTESAGSPSIAGGGSGGSEIAQAGKGSSEAGAAGEAIGGATNEAGAHQGGSAGTEAGSGGQPQGGTAGLPASSGAGGMPQGGSSGTAGTSGAPSGGTSGSGGTAGSAGSTPTLCNQPGVVVCDTFDSTPVGPEAHDPWIADPNCNGSTFSGTQIPVVSSQSFSPNHSIQSSELPYEACGLHASIGDIADYYVHMRIRFAKASGSADQFDNHASLFSVDSTLDDANGLEVGFGSCAPTTGPGLFIQYTHASVGGCTGVEPSVDTWHCLDFHVTTTAANTTTTLSLDGDNLPFILTNSSGNVPVTKMTGEVTATPYLNIATVSTSYKPAVFIDDVVVSTQPVGCQ